MSEQRTNLVYQFGRWQLDLGRRELRACGVPVPIAARAFEIMAVLVRSANDLVSKDALIDRIWPGAMVGENTLQVHVSTIRKALGQDRGMLKTVSGRGYRLLGDWAVRPAATADPPIGLRNLARMPDRTFRHNLPGAAPELVGRTTAAQEIPDILSSYRAVTLTGPAGVGKTALALHVARSMCPSFGGDVWFVELASLSDPSAVPTALARVLGLNPDDPGITAEVVAWTIGHQPILLVLDNCEHVIDAAARLVEAILRLCTRANVLATSQEPLRIAGEYAYRVPPLEVPRGHSSEPDDVLKQGAVQLFVARLQALDCTFALSRENVRLIVAICQHLDGVPLAIELAAARAATLGVQYVASNLEDRFALLISGRRTALPKHQTLRAALDWSYKLLPAAEQYLLRRLAAFEASFTLEAVNAAVSVAGYSEAMVLDGIARLVDKSFLVLDRSQSDDRWALPETIRAYALTILLET